MLESIVDILLSTAIVFALAFGVLFIIYYFTSPIYTEYGDKRSRLYYSLLNSLYFSLVLAILFAVLPGLSNSYGVLVSLAVGLVIILITTAIQVYAVAALVRGGFLKMRQKTRKYK
ncbi:hypothetical protein [Methanocella conradii]|uniref:hypothetical protein n=1 Tax=Methanocella conradii TaxID=1175444 RepID=UPI0024B3666F|nr:hypothetical protein [Methanocella conradii]MDI6898034.1 hypothetical protein [Methanocella conradii]